MDYCEIRLTIPPDALEAVSNLLVEADTGGVVIDDEHAAVLRAYLPRDERLTTRLQSLRQSLSDLVAFFPGLAELQQEERTVHEEDWANAWREHFHPTRIGERLVVAPTWEDFLPTPNDVVVRLDPGMAFGTGTHPSTILCLRALEELVQPGMRVLDIGTGSGILAIAAALLGAADVVALDNDPLAVRVARQNVEDNRARIQVHYAELKGVLQSGFVPADVATANLTASTLVPLAADIAEALRPGGIVVASGIVGTGAHEVEEAFAACGLHIIRSERLEDWIALWVQRV